MCKELQKFSAPVNRQLRHSLRGFGARGRSRHQQQLASSSKARTHIQPKLTVSTPGDMYEQEADRIAE